jgi:hypothetical protein
MVELEIGVRRSQCLDRRLPDPDRLVAEIGAWERQRKAVSVRINRISRPSVLAPSWPVPIQRPSTIHKLCAAALVVIDQINIRRVALLEAENDPPVRAHGDAPVPGKIAPQRMPPETRNVALRRPHSLVEPREHGGNFVHMVWVDLAAVVVFVKAAKAAMSKVPNHRYQ